MYQILITAKSQILINEQIANNRLEDKYKNLTHLNTALFLELFDHILSDNASSIEVKHHLVQCLLNDAYVSLNGEIKPTDKTKPSTDHTLIFILACLAGLVFAFIDGLDGIVSILQLVPISSALFILTVSFFSILSATVFIAFDVVEAANNFGFAFSKPENTLVTIKSEKQLIAKLIGLIEKKSLLEVSVIHLNMFSDFLSLMGRCNETLDKRIEEISDNKDNSLYLYLAQKVAAVLCCLLFLSFGFFTGQAGALFLLGNITMKLAMSQPIMALFTIACASISSVGCAAFYWMVQRPGVENLVSKLFYGIDQDMLDELNVPEQQLILSQSITTKLAAINEKSSLLTENQAFKNAALVSLPGSSARKLSFFPPEARPKFHTSTVALADEEQRLRHRTHSF